MSNTFGKLFTITTFGESHGEGIGLVIDGCPAGVELDLPFIQSELDRRKPGTSRITTQRKESDSFELLSGHIDGKTTGTPLGFFVRNTNARSKDYSHIKDIFRPSHADFTYHAKYGIRDYKGGGRSSARETLARVIGGAIAKLALRAELGVEVEAWVQQIHKVKLLEDPKEIKLIDEYQQATRCPNPAIAKQMYEAVDAARRKGDSVGGIVKCRIKNAPAGIGEPIYNKLSATLGAAMLSINAVKGFELGSGFEGTEMFGSEHNDSFYMEGSRTRTRSNHAGGVLGGISTGEEIYFRVAFKPTATIMQDQATVDSHGNEAVAEGKGRHDPCVVPRAVPIVEAMAAMVLLDQWMLHKARMAM
ncbi:MAG: chorismate synthase [Bacteroidia bacterium]|nr:chorismate synthase [Bacteroidia bacterium]